MIVITTILKKLASDFNIYRLCYIHRRTLPDRVALVKELLYNGFDPMTLVTTPSTSRKKTSQGDIDSRIHIRWRINMNSKDSQKLVNLCVVVALLLPFGMTGAVVAPLPTIDRNQGGYSGKFRNGC
jgi:hypothetical protein